MLDRHSPWDQPWEAALDTASAGVHPGDRFEFWHEVARRTVVDHNSGPKCSLHFQAELQASALAASGIFILHISPMVVAHATRHMSHASTDGLFIYRQVGAIR